MPSEVSTNLVPDWKNMAYYPIIYISDFWVLKKDMIPLNETLLDEKLNVSLTF